MKIFVLRFYLVLLDHVIMINIYIYIYFVAAAPKG